MYNDKQGAHSIQGRSSEKANAEVALTERRR